MNKKMVCIVCPRGCNMEVEYKDLNKIIVSGNHCKRGKIYAESEIKDPKRIVPTTVVIKDALFDRLPVKTEKPIPKNLIFEVMKLINNVTVSAPVKVGDVIIENILDTGTNVVASKSVERVKFK